MSSPREFGLTLSCRDTKGIVYAAADTLFEAGRNIVDAQQSSAVPSGGTTPRR